VDSRDGAACSAEEAMAFGFDLIWWEENRGGIDGRERSRRTGLGRTHGHGAK
jgi:hypothetical protein